MFKKRLTIVARTIIAPAVLIMGLTPAAPASADTPLFGNANDFVDTWRNGPTHDVKRVVISPGAFLTRVYVRIYFSCGDGECESGRREGFWDSAGTDRIAVEYPTNNSQGYVYAQRKLTLRMQSNGDVLDYQFATNFVDPARADFVRTGRLQRD